MRAPDLNSSHAWHAYLQHPGVQHTVDSVSPGGTYPSTMHVIFSQGAALAYPRYIVSYTN